MIMKKAQNLYFYGTWNKLINNTFIKLFTCIHFLKSIFTERIFTYIDFKLQQCTVKKHTYIGDMAWM